jgi:hypothetical protein
MRPPLRRCAARASGTTSRSRSGGSWSRSTAHRGSRIPCSRRSDGCSWRSSPTTPRRSAARVATSRPRMIPPAPLRGRDLALTAAPAARTGLRVPSRGRAGALLPRSVQMGGAATEVAGEHRARRDDDPAPRPPERRASSYVWADRIVVQPGERVAHKSTGRSATGCRRSLRGPVAAAPTQGLASDVARRGASPRPARCDRREGSASGGGAGREAQRPLARRFRRRRVSLRSAGRQDPIPDDAHRR